MTFFFPSQETSSALCVCSVSDFSNRNAWEVDLLLFMVPLSLLVPMSCLVEATVYYQNWEEYITGFSLPLSALGIRRGMQNKCPSSDAY